MVFKVLRRSLTAWNQTQECSIVSGDGDNLDFITLGNRTVGLNLQRVCILIRECNVNRFGVRIDANTRGVTTTYTTRLDGVATAQIITVLTLISGYAVSDVVFRGLEGQTLQSILGTNPPDAGGITFRGFGWSFSQ